MKMYLISKYKSVLFRNAVFILFLLLSINFTCAKSSFVGTDNDSVNQPAFLDTGRIINAKMKSLAAGTPMIVQNPDTRIKGIRSADSLPDDFQPSEANTITSESSPFPVYIFFDNANNQGIIYIYSESRKIVADPSLNYAFYRMSSLNDISGLSDWDVSQVEDMTNTFSATDSLTDVSPLKDWDTSNTISFSGIFSFSGIMDATPLSKWNTSNAITMSFMFAQAKSLTKADVSYWNTSKVSDMKSMFAVGESYQGNGRLTEIIGLANLDVSNVTDMTAMFYGAGKMTCYDIAGWDVSKVLSFNHMFCDNFNLRSLDLSAWNVSHVKTMYNMFDDNYSLTTIGDVSNWDTSSLIDVGGWLNGAHSFVGESGVLDLSGWKTDNLKVAGEMFRGVKLQAIDLSGWTFSSFTNDTWPEAHHGIFYTSGNTSGFKGLAGMFLNTSRLSVVYVSSSGFTSYQNAVNKGISTTDMWKGSSINDFTVSDIPVPLQ